VKTFQPEVPVPDDYELAEAFFKKGALDKALESYATYLEKQPLGTNSGPALYRMGEIYSQRGELKEALKYYERLVAQHPDDPRLAEVRYQVVDILYGIGQYADSRDQALQWIRAYRGHTLEAKVLHILGLDNLLLGNRDQAFYWWVQAKKISGGDAHLQSELLKKLGKMIDGGDVQTLERFAVYAEQTDLAPRIYYRIASLYLSTGDLLNARKAAMALVRATPEQKWVTLGKGILDRITAELSVKKRVFGCLLPLSGPFAIYGQEVLNGIELGLGLFRKTGEEGPGIDLVIKDTQGKSEVASAQVAELAQKEHAMGIIGPLSSKASLASARKAEELGIPIITMTQKEDITREGDMVFRNFLVPCREIKTLLNVAVKQLGLKRFAILYPENPYGRFLMNRFWDGLEEAGGSITAVESYEPDQTDFADPIKKMTGLYYPRPASVVKKLREMRTPFEEETEIEPEKPEPIIDFDAVFIPDNYQKIIMIAPQLMYQDVSDVRLVGTSLWQSPKLIEMAAKYVQGAIFTSGFFGKRQDPLTREFVKGYEESFESTPGILAATGYDTIRFLKALMRRRAEIQTRKDLQRAIPEVQAFKGVTGDITFDAQGEVMKIPLALTISGRHMTVLQPMRGLE
jgi:ABC-type branched-subunit amino acid transport system substrate-binding protein